MSPPPGLRWSRLRRETAAVAQLHGYSRTAIASRLARHLPLPTALKLLLRKHLGGSRALIHDVLVPDGFERSGTDLPAAARLAYRDAGTVLGKSHLQLSVTNLPELLRYEDRNSMAHSIESRVPFLDHPLVEFAARLPQRLKLRGWTTKYVLRRAMRGLLPPEILSRRKMGFPVPVGAWLRAGYRPLVDEFILGPRALGRGLFNADALRTMVAAHASGAEPHGQRLWALINFEIWQRIFLDGEGAGAITMPGA